MDDERMCFRNLGCCSYNIGLYIHFMVLISSYSNPSWSTQAYMYVRDIVEEGAERRYGLVADMLELDHKVATQLLVNDGDWDGAWFILEEVTVVRGLQLNLQIWREGAQTTRGERGCYCRRLFSPSTVSHCTRLR